MRYGLLLTACLLLLTIAGWSQTLLPRKYPSARVAHVIPGGGTYQNPTDPDVVTEFVQLYGEATADRVMLWETQHADFTSGGVTDSAVYNANYCGTVYVYYQSLMTTIAYRETGLRLIALNHSWDFENFYCHFAEDSYLDGNKVFSTNTIFYGRPPLLGYAPTYTDNCVRPFSPTSDTNVDVLATGSRSGLWVAVPEKVDQIRFILSQGGDPGATGELVIEYVNGVDANYHITSWGRITPVEDTTNGLRRSGVIRWVPPADWKFCVPYPPHFLGSALLTRGKAGCFFFRVRVVNYVTSPRIAAQDDAVWLEPVQLVETTGYRTGVVISATANTVKINNGGVYKKTDYYKGMIIEIVSGTGAGQQRSITASTASLTPTLTVSSNWDVLPDSTSTYRITGPTLKIRGWDARNDRNGDGYVDDSEFANLVNPNATARMRWQARVSGPTDWSKFNATCRANVWSAEYRQALLEYYVPLFHSVGAVGYMNDDARVLTSYANTQVLYGGHIEEYNGVIGHDQALADSYRDYFLLIHEMFRDAGVQWRGANISTSNMWLSSDTRLYLQNNRFTFFDCERTAEDKDALQSNLSVLGSWEWVAYAKVGVRPVVSMMISWDNFLSRSNTQASWERIKQIHLARFYLFNIPDMMFFHSWNRTYNYGSYNTVLGTGIRGYYKTGVPQNYAYIPHKMLSVDIGEPSGYIPTGYLPVPYIVGRGKNTVIGNTTQTQLSVPDVGTVDVYPTYVFFLWRSTAGGTVPDDAVLARMYTKGIVLLRVPKYPPSGSSYDNYTSDTNAVVVNLPDGPYRRVNYDGTLGPQVTQVAIRGYEGIVLVRDTQQPPASPNVQVSISVDKTNPKPLDVVTVTITARNVGNAEARNVRIQHNIPSEATYVLGSLKVNGATVADPTDTTKIDVTIPSVPAGGQATVQFQMVIR